MSTAVGLSGDLTLSPPVYTTHGQKLYIARSLINELVEHGRSSPDKEVCGLITGLNATYLEAKQYYPITNISTGNLGYDDYVMDPQESMDVLKDTSIMPGGKSDTDLVAVFHTHPRSTPFPSIIDIKHAAYNAVYIIYSVTLHKFSFHYWNGEWFVPVDIEEI